MTKGFGLRLLAAAAVAIPSVASAQWSPGAELVGQPLQVTTNGVTNTVYLDAGGALRIITPASNVVGGTWQASGGQLCLTVAGATECIAYTEPFQAGVPRNVTTSCNAVSSWLASTVNPPGSSTPTGAGR